MTISVMLSKLSEGMVITLFLFVVTVVFSLPLGLIVSFGRMSKNKIIQSIVKVYISIMRGTPLMLHLMVIYFGPYYNFGIQLSSTWKNYAVAIGFILNYAAYFAEIYSVGIEFMSPGQYEAAQILGYNKTQTFVRIILPQVIKRILPSVTNELITLVKDTSLARIIALQEIIWAGQAFMKGSQGISGAIWPLFFTAVYYLIFNGVLTVLLGQLEKKLDYFR